MSDKITESIVETKKRKAKVYVVMVFIMLMILVGAAGVLVNKFYTENLKLSNNLKFEQGLNKENITLIDKKQKELDGVLSELKQLKARIEGIKNRDDLLKRDIELYIRSTYRKVPKVVAKTIASTIVEFAKKEDMSPELIVGIIQVESQFNPMAVGVKTKYGHARGLMQVMPEWAKKFGLSTKYDLHDIDINIASGIRVFQIHLKEGKGNISQGLYYYVNKDKAYVGKVYTAMGKFVSFRSTVDDDEKSEEVDNNGDSKEKEKIKKSEPDKGTGQSS